MASNQLRLYEGVPSNMVPLIKNAIEFHEQRKNHIRSKGRRTPLTKIQNFLNYCSIDVLKALALNGSSSTNHRRQCVWTRLAINARNTADAKGILTKPDSEAWLMCHFLTSTAYFVRFPLENRLISHKEAGQTLACVEKANSTILKQLVERKQIRLKLFDLLYSTGWEPDDEDLSAVGAVPLQRLLIGLERALADELNSRVSQRPSLPHTEAIAKIYKACQQTFRFQDTELVEAVADLLFPSSPDAPRSRYQVTRLQTPEK